MFPNKDGSRMQRAWILGEIGEILASVYGEKNGKIQNTLLYSLGLSWDRREGNRLIYPKVIGRPGHARTLQRYSIKWEGVRLFNSIPLPLRKWSGLKELFKNMLDKFLENKPDRIMALSLLPHTRNVRGELRRSLCVP